MMWSGIPAAISVDSATVMEDDWTSKVYVTRTSNKLHRNLIYESCGQYPELSTTVLCLSLVISGYLLLGTSAIYSYIYPLCGYAETALKRG